MFVDFTINRFQQISTDFKRFHQISTDFNRFHKISIDFNRFKQISIDFIRFQQISTDFNTCQQTSTDFKRFHQIFAHFNQFQRTSTDFNRFQQISTDFSRFQQISADFNNFMEIVTVRLSPSDCPSEAKQIRHGECQCMKSSSEYTGYTSPPTQRPVKKKTYIEVITICLWLWYSALGHCLPRLIILIRQSWCCSSFWTMSEPPMLFCALCQECAEKCPTSGQCHVFAVSSNSLGPVTLEKIRSWLRRRATFWTATF